MSNAKPKVSLGIPLYNESEFLEETIISLLNQSYKDIEIVAIDNNSSDGSFKILQKYSKKDKRLKIYKNKSNIDHYQSTPIPGKERYKTYCGT